MYSYLKDILFGLLEINILNKNVFLFTKLGGKALL